MKVAIIGCGNMGAACAKAMRREKLIEQQDVLLIDNDSEKVSLLEENQVGNGVAISAVSEADVVMLAVKPQSFGSLKEVLKGYIKSEQIIVSIMAGVSIDVIKGLLPTNKVVRAMPNTPCQIGKGATGYYVSFEMKEAERQFLSAMFDSTGVAVQVNNEDNVDAVTAVSGSGPAYFYYFLKHIIQSGEEMGLDASMAKTLALQTMSGAHQLMLNHDGDIDELISAVKSKGGTTEAALNKMIEKQVGESINEALKTAKIRAAELSKMLEI